MKKFLAALLAVALLAVQIPAQAAPWGGSGGFYGGTTGGGSGSGGSGNLTVGSSTIGSGVSGSFGYNNAGVYGERTPVQAGDAIFGTSATQPNPLSVLRYYDGTTASYQTANNYAYNFDPLNLPRLTACLAKVRASAGNCRILMVGDSTTWGAYALNSSNTGDSPRYSYPAFLAYSLNAAGIPAQREAFFGDTGSAGQNNLTADTRVATGSFTQNAGKSLGGNFFAATSASGGDLTFTPDTPVDRFKIWYITVSGGGSFQYAVDGAASGGSTQSTNGSTAFSSVTVSASALGKHTLHIGWVSSTVSMVGIEAYSSTISQVQIMNAGMSSSLTSDWVVNTQPYSTLNAVATLAADAIFVDLGINDWNNAVAVATTKANKQTLLTSYLTTSDVVLVTPAPSGISVTALATQKTFINADYQLAVSNSVPLIDNFSRWVSYERTNPAPFAFYQSGTVVHPNSVGYADFAAGVVDPILKISNGGSNQANGVIFSGAVSAPSYQVSGLGAIGYPTNDSTAGASEGFGYQALAGQTGSSAAYKNTAVGYQTMQAGTLTTAAIKNTALGFQALNGLTTGAANTCIGQGACTTTIALQSGNSTTVMGDSAHTASSSSSAATIFGQNATAAGNSTAVGQGSSATGGSSAVFGLSASDGGNAGAAVFGASAGNASLGANSTAMGLSALNSTTGAGNSAVGYTAGKFISSGTNNTAFGFQAMLGITGTKITGSNNTTIGKDAGLVMQGAAGNNTIVGALAGNATGYTGTYTILGAGVGQTCATGTGGIYIGVGTSTADCTSASTSNEMKIAGGATPILSATAINGTAPLAVFGGTGAVQIPAGTVAQRPTGAAGKIRENSDTRYPEVYTGADWEAVDLSTPNFTNLFNPAFNRLTKWRTALGKVSRNGVAGTQNAHLLMQGSSTVDGYCSKDLDWSRANTLEGITAQWLKDRYGYEANDDNMFGFPPGGDPRITSDTRIAIGAGWGSDTIVSIGGEMWVNTTTTNAIDYTAPTRADRAKIYYPLDTAGLGTISWTLNGGSANNIAETAAEAVGTTVITLTPGANTIHIKRVSGTAKFIGIEFYLTTEPTVNIINSGRGSFVAGNWVDASGKAYASPAAFSALAPDLSFILINNLDAISGTADATYKAAIQAIMNQLTNGDVVIGSQVPYGAGAGTIGNNAAILADLQALATTNSVPYLDWATRTGSYVNFTTFGATCGDDLHMNSVGYLWAGRNFTDTTMQLAGQAPQAGSTLPSTVAMNFPANHISGHGQGITFYTGNADSITAFNIFSDGSLGFGAGAAAAGVAGETQFRSAASSNGTSRFDLTVTDTTAQAVGTGGGINLAGNDGATDRAGAGIRACKINNTSTNYSFGACFSHRLSGASPADWLATDPTKNIATFSVVPVVAGTKFTAAGGGCTVASTVGGATSGTFTANTTGTCTTTITMNGATGMTAPTGWTCDVTNRSTGAKGGDTTSSATTATIAVATTSGNTVSFHCEPF